jgi:phosphate transport system substrate-binding protein
MQCRTLLLTAACIAASLPACTSSTNSAGGPVELSGQGSTFVKPMMDKWVQDYTHAHKDVKINYQGSGTTAGIKAMTERANDFGCGDAYMKDEEIKKAQAEGGEVIHVPLVLGAIVPAYNLPGLRDPLNFDGDVLAGIFMGKITKWNDPAIVSLNKDAKLPDLPIAVVHRAEGSGSTFIFSSYLNLTNDTWKNERGASTTIDWKGVGTGEKGTAGVAGAISKSEGAIGYIELTYALEQKGKIQYGTAKNAEGEFVRGDTASVTKAAENFVAAKKVQDDLRYNLANAPGKGSYPIAGTTWAFMYVNQKGAAAQGLKDFFTYVLTDGQKECAELGYAPLPESLAKMAQDKVKSITVK